MLVEPVVPKPVELVLLLGVTTVALALGVVV
jgi:hypothetical protein